MQVTQSLGASAAGAAAVRLSVQLANASPGLPDVAFERQLPGLFAKPQLAQADIAPPVHSHKCTWAADLTQGCSQCKATRKQQRTGRKDVHADSRSMRLTMAELISVWHGNTALVDGVPCLAVADA